jgi:glycogen(starch) synthase
MNHLIISREYPPSSYPQGGIGTYVAHIARLLAERGETVHVIGQQWAGAPLSRQEYCGGRLIVHRVPADRPLRSTPEADVPRAGRVLDAMVRSDCAVQAFSWQAALLAESLIEESQIDCIEAQDYEAPSYYLLIRRAAGLGRAVGLRASSICTHRPNSLPTSTTGVWVGRST